MSNLITDTGLKCTYTKTKRRREPNCGQWYSIAQRESWWPIERRTLQRESFDNSHQTTDFSISIPLTIVTRRTVPSKLHNSFWARVSCLQYHSRCMTVNNKCCTEKQSPERKWFVPFQAAATPVHQTEHPSHGGLSLSLEQCHNQGPVYHIRVSKVRHRHSRIPEYLMCEDHKALHLTH